MPAIDPNTGRGLQQQKKTAVRVKDVLGSDDDSSDGSSSSDSSSSSSSSDEGTPAPPTSSAEQLIPMSGSAAAPKQQQQPPPSLLEPAIAAPGPSSVADDLKGLVLAPVVVPAEAERADPDFDRDSGSWTQLVRPEHAAGLSLRGRYLRGPTKARQAELLGLPSDRPSLVCLQFRFENSNPGGGASIRRLRVLQRQSSSSSSIIGPSRVLSPPEVAVLAPGETVECVVGIVFAGISDRDGSLQAKLDVKYGGGGIPIEIKPNLGDLLLPPPRKVSVEEFDASVRALQGFQRVETSVPVSSADAGTDSKLLSKLSKGAALWPATGGDYGEAAGSSTGKLRMVGTLPASSDPVYVLVDWHPPSSPSSSQLQVQVSITVCCDHALAVNSIVNQVKRALR